MKPGVDFLVRFRQATILFFVTFIAVLWTVMKNHSEFSYQELIVFYSYLAAVTGGQLLIILSLLLLRRVWSGFDLAATGLAAGFSVLNIYTILIVHHATLATLAFPWSWLLLAGLTGGFAVIYALSWRPFVKFIHIFAVIMSVMIAGQLIGESQFSVEGLFDRIPSHIKMVDFNRTPNIYVISLDALTPAVVAQQNLGVERVPYQEILAGHDVRIVRNSFAERIPTIRALNLILAMDESYFENVSEDGGFVRDQVPNPTYEILRQNGYKIQVLYSNRYFGDDKGRLDHYGIANSFGICKHIEQPYAFLGYCSDPVQDLAGSTAKTKDRPYPQMLYDRIRDTASLDQPWFTFASVYTPGHAHNKSRYNNPEDWETYRQQFIKKSARAADVLDELLSVIQDNDPDSITLIYGDHGSLLTKGAVGEKTGIVAKAPAHKAKFRDDSPVSFAQVVHDRHAVLTLLSPADACPDSFTHTPYSTMRLMRDLFICLSDQDPLPADYQTDDNVWRPYMYE